jgi:hypothetical protein
MERVGFSDDVVAAFKEAAGSAAWGVERYAVGVRMRGGSWPALIASLFFALLFGGLTTWLLAFSWPDLPFQVLMGVSFGYLMSLLMVGLAWAYSPGVRHPATWVIVWDEGMAWLSEGGTPVALAWDEIARSWHTVTSVRDQLGKEFKRAHRLEVEPTPDLAHHGRLLLPPEFPFVAEIAAFVTARVNAR